MSQAQNSASHIAAMEALPFENRYAELPAHFYHAASPHPLRGARLAGFNPRVGELLGITKEDAQQERFADYFVGERELPGAQPVAMAYAGHQFGVFVPQLGDGRAMLLGQLRDRQQQLWDLHLKGSGPTRYSRGSDGRAVLRSTIREYLCSEAMAGLGIPTTRALCLIASDEPVFRERMEPGAMLVRVAQSHIRFGSFEYFYHRGEHQALAELGGYLLDQHFPHLRDTEAPFLALFDEVIRSTAALIAQWQGVGFCHGVMNSDNMSILGLTLDYGPFAFMDTFEQGYICNRSDYQGRYAFNRQPEMAHFNLACLATALLPLIADDRQRAVSMLRERLLQFQPHYDAAYLSIVRAKLGLFSAHADDLELWHQLLNLMEGRVDYTAFFRALGSCSIAQGKCHPLRKAFSDSEPAAFDRWMAQYRQRLSHEASSDSVRREAMDAVNPLYILRNSMAEEAIRLAEKEDDFSEVSRLLSLLSNPCQEQPGMNHYAVPPPVSEQGIRLSCSS